MDSIATSPLPRAAKLLRSKLIIETETAEGRIPRWFGMTESATVRKRHRSEALMLWSVMNRTLRA